MPARSTARSPSPSPPKPSLIDRIKKPFGPKARLFSDFYIQPDDPHRVYGPGDVITGSVVLKVTKPFSVSHIVVCLHGYAQVFKTPNNPGEGHRHYNTALAAGKTRKAGGYYGNGFASLFEDEITLCGDGRLGEGTYQFNFELIFPRQHLPSSIEFERGTVSYLITATMTRATTISPTSTCERSMNFQEDIDVAPLSQPKPRVITLEPITRRTKARHRVKRQPTTGNEPATAASTADSEDTATETPGTDRATESGSQIGVDPPQSPVPSDVSLDSYMSSGTGSAIDSCAPSARTCESRHTNGKLPHSCSNCQKNPITATITMERAGFLRGDIISLKVWLTHTRAVKSLRGVIVTLYRQARVDMHPALPVIRGGGEDDASPKVRTGLAGLSLSSTGSTHTYRKDLDQQFGSLIVNPATMQAEVKVALRVPEEAFPSIASVPGAMISFKYYVEVVVDIQGKLAGLDKYLPNAGPPQGGMLAGRPGEGNTYAPWGGHFINTEEIRRERSVIYSVFEVVVGTRDSERRSTWKQPQNDVSATAMGPEVLQNNISQSESHAVGPAGQPVVNGEHGLHRPLSWDQYWRHHPPDSSDQPPPLTAQFSPPPGIEETERGLSEKERMQRAEARLLPSAPPPSALDGESSHTGVAPDQHAPSAPALDAYDLRQPIVPASILPSAPPELGLEHDHHVVTAGPSAPGVQTASHFNDGDDAEPSAPAYDYASQTVISTTDDKEELRRRRLEMERSAPPEMQHDDDHGHEARDGNAPSAPNLDDTDPSAPSAPVLADVEDHYGFGEPGVSALPRYER